jgi:hypothetical protein
MNQSRVLIRSVFVVGVACGLLVVASLLASVWALPPRPTPEPTATPIPTPTLPPVPPAPSSRPEGGLIELRVQFPQTWPWGEVHWQTLWTVVQWQDGADWPNPGGDWHDVEGWQGELENIAIGEVGEVVGRRAWWVTKADLGKGLFRWQVYRGKEDVLLVTSEPFYLPDANGQTRVVEVSLAP